MSKKIVVDAAGAPTATDAKLVDLFGTLISTDTALTGTYALVQKAGLVAFGMGVQNARLGLGWNPLKTV